MSYKSLRYKITGVSPLILHNGRLANPLDKFSKAIKTLTDKKKGKTDADIEEISRLEWLGSLYVSDGKPCLPGEVLEAAIRSGAKKTSKGKDVQVGLYCPDSYLIKYDGPTNVDELWQNEDFRIVALVKVGQSKVMRTRPVFKNWSCEFEAKFDPSVLNEDQVDEFIRTCGESCGLCDWRPKFGRFTTEKLNGKI